MQMKILIDSALMMQVLCWSKTTIPTPQIGRLGYSLDSLMICVHPAILAEKLQLVEPQDLQ